MCKKNFISNWRLRYGLKIFNPDDSNQNQIFLQKNRGNFFVAAIRNRRKQKNKKSSVLKEQLPFNNRSANLGWIGKQSNTSNVGVLNNF